MNFGVDLGGIALDDLLNTLLRTDRDNHYYVFHVDADLPAFPTDVTHVRCIQLPGHGGARRKSLEDHLRTETRIDALFRAGPDDAALDFPLDRQVVFIPDSHDEPTRDRLRILRRFLTYAGAVGVGSEDVLLRLQADPWTRCDDLFLLSPVPSGLARLLGGVEAMTSALEQMTDDATLRDRLLERGRLSLQDFTWDDAARNLRSALERVARRSLVGRASIRVRTPPTVSIVTPSLNQGLFIRRTIDSVLSQDYPHVDYRVVDGGSTDETVEILRSYGDRFTWTSEKDRGQAHAVNKGMSQACGQVLTYLNSDDVLRPGALSRVVSHFDERPHCDLIYGRDVLIDAEDRECGTYPTDEYSFERLMERCCISQPAAFWRDRIARQVGPFDESLHLVLDYDYWLRIDRAGGTLEHVPDVLACTRCHSETKSHSVKTSPTRFYDELFAVCRKHGGFVSATYVYYWVVDELLRKHPWLSPFQKQIVRAATAWYRRRREERPSLSSHRSYPSADRDAA